MSTWNYKKLVTLLTLVFVVCLAFIVYLNTLSSHTTVWNGIFSSVIGLLYLIGGGVGLQRVNAVAKEQGQNALKLMAISMLCQGVGLVCWSFYNLVLNIQIPFPSPITVFFAVQNLLLALGMWAYEDTISKEEGIDFPWISAAPIIVVACMMIIVVISRQDLYSHLPLWERVMNTMGMLGHAFVVSLGLAMVMIKKLRSPGLMMFVGGIVLLALANVVFFYQVTKGEFWNGGYADAIITASGFMFGLGMLKLLQEKEALK